jgi:membrane-associated phospholipid phosphatase
VIGGAAWIFRGGRVGRAILYVGVVQLIAYLAADLSKPQFGRLRPFEAFDAGGADVWFVGANSFPSGHVAYFAGLVVPIVMLSPRAWLLLLVPIVVAAQRILSADHYLCDACGSIVLAVLVAWALRPLAGTANAASGPPQNPSLAAGSKQTS